jgi:RNA-directed DNA polymerase
MSDFVTTLRHWIATLAQHHAAQGLKSIHHKLDKWLMAEAHRELDGSKATGVDGVTKEQYSQGLSQKLDDLVDRVRSQTYRAPPVRGVDIPKGNGETRPLGISAYEDKVLQKAFVMLVEPVFEREFLDCSYGFRPGRNCHMAVRAVRDATISGHHWIIDLDIRKYFDSIAHQPLQEMFAQRIRDGVLRRLILGWLKAGVLREGQWEQKEEGTPQGGIVSPLLSNLYLHEILDKWVQTQVVPRLRGSLRLIRYADDAVLCFTHQEDARRVMRVLEKRLAKYGLTMHPEKTRLVDFRPPARYRRRETFNFLGFTFYWGLSKKGRRTVKLKTDRKRLSRKLNETGQWCRENRHCPIAEQHQTLVKKIEGHAQHYGVSFNYEGLKAYARGVWRVWLKWLNRRGAPKAINYEKFGELLDTLGRPELRIVYPLWGNPESNPCLI